MTELHTLGGLGLRSSDGRELLSVLSHPKRTALLVYLALASPHGFHRRDSLLPLFWPELDTEHARAALRKLVHYLRRSLGNGVLVGRGDEELGLAEGSLGCDVLQFERALASGQPGKALELYRGELLPGFHIADAPEFERWLDGERARLQRQAADAAWTLANADAAAGEVRAAEWARRAVSLAPYDEMALRRLLALLDGLGDRAEAVRAFDEFSRRLDSEFGVEPAPETRRLIEEIRLRAELPPTAPPQRGSATALPQPERVPSGFGSEGRPADAGGGEASPRANAARAPPSWSISKGGRRRLAAALGVAVLGALMASPTRWPARSLPASTPGGSEEMPAPDAAGNVHLDRIAVLPFTVYGSPDVQYLGAGIVHLLSANLNSAATARSVDPHALLTTLARSDNATIDPMTGVRIAERFGARLFVLGQITETAGQLRIQASLYRRARQAEPIAEAGVQGQADQLFRLVDDLTAQLLAGQLRGPGARIARVAALTTHSVPALKAYLDAEAAYFEGRYEEALADLRRATAADSGFALAWYRTSLTQGWLGVSVSEHRHAAERAVRHAQQLSDPDRLLLEAHRAFVEGRLDEAERLYRTVVGQHPDELEAWYQLGETLFHLGPLLGRPIGASREAYRRVLAIDPQHQSSLLHLARIAALEGKLAAVAALTERALGPQLDAADRLDLRALRAFALQDRSEQTRLLRELRNASDVALMGTVWNVNVFSRNLAGGGRVARLLTEPTRAPEIRARGYIIAAYLEAAQGRWRSAAAQLDTAATIDPDAALIFRGFLAGLDFLPIARTERETIRTRVIQWQGPAFASRMPMTAVHIHEGVEPHLRLYISGLLDLRLGRGADVERQARQLGNLDDPPLSSGLGDELAKALRAHITHAEGRPAEALRILDPTAGSTWGDLALDSPLFSRAYERFLRAEILSALGRDDEALRWLDSFTGLSSYDLVFLAPAHLRSGEIHERRGESAAAIADYGRFAELWRDCEPELQPLVQEVAERITRLRHGD